jgi:hypothetical protein
LILAQLLCAAVVLQVGAVLSQGQQNKRRLMYVWSADGSVQPGSAAWARKQQQRRQTSRVQSTSTEAASSSKQEDQQQQSVMLEVAPAADRLQQQLQQQPQQQQQMLPAESNGSSKPSKPGGLFGKLFNALLSGLSDDDQQQQRRDSSSQQAAEPSDLAAASDSSSSSQQQSEAEQAGAVGDGEEEQGDDAGVFMYGAAVLSMKGPIALEPVTCQVRLLGASSCSPAGVCWRSASMACLLLLWPVCARCMSFRRECRRIQ